MDISIVIINYRTIELTISCIDSLIQYTSGLSYEIILVENGSGEFDLEHVAGRWGDRVSLIISKENLGFAKGNNLGIRHAEGKYVLLLNSDTYLTDNALLPLFRFMEAHPEAGAASPRLVYPDGRAQGAAQRFPSVKYALVELLRLQKLAGPKKRGRLLLGAFFDHRESVEADWIWAACMIIPKKIINQLPGKKLDEGYFMYWEDVQWCMDIKRLGYKIFFFGDVEIVHIHGASKGKKNELMRQNRQQFMQRNYPAWQSGLIGFLDKMLGRA